MKILHLSYSDIGGGAARAAYRIHRCLLESGCDSRMLVLDRRTRDSSVDRFQPSTAPLRRLARGWRRHSIESKLQAVKDKSNPFSVDRSWLGSELGSGLPQCDLIHLHWVAGMVDFRAFLPEAARRTPLVWTLHDMNPFTGGCHYDASCGRFSEHCRECPMLDQKLGPDVADQVFQSKQAAFSKIAPSRLHVVTPSQWLTSEASRSALLGKFKVSTIPYGLDLNVFAPKDKNSAREVLGIPRDAIVVLFVAQSIGLERKGHRFLMEALQPLENVFLLSLGSGQASGKKNSLHLGFVEQDLLLALVYSAADLFAATSLEDNLPQTVLEAMACGLPVVGFNVGGIPDAVQQGVTGLLVPPGDSRQLRGAIESLIADPAQRARMGAQSRRAAEAKFGALQQATAYRDVYEQLLKS